MDHGSIRLAFGIGWLATAAIVTARPMGDWKLVALTALALAVWNLNRWYTLRFTRPVRTSTRGNRSLRPSRSRTEEYNPEFDFTKHDSG